MIEGNYELWYLRRLGNKWKIEEVMKIGKRRQA